MASKVEGRARRKLRIRKKVDGTAERPRLTRVPQQQADLRAGRSTTRAARRSRRRPRSASGAKARPRAARRDDGRGRSATAIASACLKDKGITQVVFDRNGYIYHGRVKALADGAREAAA